MIGFVFFFGLKKEIQTSHLLRESLQWPVSISPRRPRTGRVWRGGSLHSWVVPSEEGEPQRGYPGNSRQLSGCSPSRWPALSLEGWVSGAFPFRLRFLLCRQQPADPICLPRLLEVYPVSSPWLRFLCSVFQSCPPLSSPAVSRSAVSSLDGDFLSTPPIVWRNPRCHGSGRSYL